jgi:hypothetical protein
MGIGTFSPVPNRQRKRLLILTLTATEVKVDFATESLVMGDANDYNARIGCGTHEIGTEGVRPGTSLHGSVPASAGRAS